MIIVWPIEKFIERFNYIGHSKASIKDLFEVEKPFSVEDTIEKIENFLLEN